MKTYVFKVNISNGMKFIPIVANSMLNAVKEMKAKGWKNFVLV